jgi:hypothetical protein
MSQNPQRRFEPAGVSQKVEEKEKVLAPLHRADQLPTGLGRVMAVLFLSFDVANQPGHRPLKFALQFE